MKNLTSLLIILVLFFGSFILLRRKAKQTIARNKQDNVLLVGTNTDYPPFSFIKKDKIVGVDIDVVRAVAERLGKKLQLKDMPFDMLLPKLQLGSLEVLAAGMTGTKRRARKVYFTKPFVEHDPLLIISRKKNPIESVENLSGKRVVVNEGFTADAYVTALEGPEVIRLGTPPEAFLSLESKQSDAFVAAQSSVAPFFNRFGKDNFFVVPIEGEGDSYSLAVSQEYPQLFHQIERALDALRADGTLGQIKKKWNFND